MVSWVAHLPQVVGSNHEHRWYKQYEQGIQLNCFIRSQVWNINPISNITRMFHFIAVIEAGSQGHLTQRTHWALDPSLKDAPLEDVPEKLLLINNLHTDKPT